MEKIVKENTRADADGYFLSCTNTRMIEAIEDLERDLGKPVINSNQATIWACLKQIGNSSTAVDRNSDRLFQSRNGDQISCAVHGLSPRQLFSQPGIAFLHA